MLELVEKRLGKKSGAAKRVDQQFLIRRHKIDNQIAERVGDAVVGLRKNARPGSRAQGVMTVRNIMLTQVRQLPIHLVQRDRAMFDIDQAMRIAAEISDDSGLGVNGDSISIAVLKGRGDDWPHRHVF